MASDSFISRVQQWFFGSLASALLDSSQKERMTEIAVRRAYRSGYQRPALKVKPNQANDNVTLNLIGKAVDQSLSMLFGESIKVDLGGVEDDAPEQDWLDRAWQANGSEILLKRLGMMGADSGICYAKLMPDGKTGPLGGVYPRIIAMDPLFMDVITDPSDWEKVLQYVYEYEVEDPESGKAVKYKQVIRLDGEAWVIEDYKTEPGRSKYELMPDQPTWTFPFSPIVNWQNLPGVSGVIGEPDVTDDIIQLQDRINYAAANINKILRLNAHPRWYATGFGSGQLDTIAWGPEDLLKLPPESMVGSAEMQGDMGGSKEWVSYLTQELYSLMRSVDVSNVKDKLGQLTNFGVKMLYQDALAKNNDKRDLYGEGIVTLSRNMLIMGGVYSTDLEPIRVIWPEPIPTNEKEEIEALVQDMDNGLVSKQTAAQKRGYDWATEQERIAGEKAAEGTVGDEILRLFENGGGL